MLNQVAKSIIASNRQVVLRHPNAIVCVVFRPTVNREDLDALGAVDSDEIGGNETLGGLGVLDAVDEEDTDWEEVGEGRIVFTGVVPSELNDRQDGLTSEAEVTALVEFLDAPKPGELDADGKPKQGPQLKKRDVIYTVFTDDVHLVHEVVRFEGALHIPPYTRKPILAPRDDLSYLKDEVGGP